MFLGISLLTITIAGILLFISKEVTDPDQLVALAGYAEGWYQPCHCPRRGNQQKPGHVWSPHTALDLLGKPRPFVPVLPSCCSLSIVESWKNRRDFSHVLCFHMCSASADTSASCQSARLALVHWAPKPPVNRGVCGNWPCVALCSAEQELSEPACLHFNYLLIVPLIENRFFLDSPNIW